MQKLPDLNTSLPEKSNQNNKSNNHSNIIKEERKEIDDLIKRIQSQEKSRISCKIVFFGFFRTGKATICGDLLYLTRALDKMKLAKLPRSRSSIPCWRDCLVTQQPEKEVEEIWLRTPHKKIEIVDTFIGFIFRELKFLEKATQLDAMCVVVSASIGEFEAGFRQDDYTKESLKMAKISGVSSLVIIVNKMEHPTVLWSQERYQGIKNEVTRYLNKLAFHQKQVYFIPVSAQSKENIMGGIAHPLGSWYKGPTLLKLLDHLPVSTGDPSGPLRVSISGKSEYLNTIEFIGKVESGTLTSEMELNVTPSMQKIIIKEILNNENESVYIAKPGDSIKIQIETKEIDINKISQGNILSLPSNLPEIYSLIECRITILDLHEETPFTVGSEFVLYLHNIIQDSRIVSIQEGFQEKEKTSKKAKSLGSWSKGIVRIALNNGDPICCEKFSVLPKLGRFFLYDGFQCIAYGKILRGKPIKMK